ncbi:MAG TPA: phosphatase PAP2 family protein [Verrucomicrobiae bacterium]|jgi:undecaprenyl-diphosphatase|nr:phosphatase PAP2 family protein [Verrucomicrobiae bacterium]
MAVPRKLPWNGLLWLLAGAVAVALAWPLDNAVDAALDASKNLHLHQLAWWCSKLGEGWVPAVAGIFLAILFLLLNRPVVAARIFFVMLTCELTGLAGLILRIVFGRTRPLAHAAQGFYGVWHDGHWIMGKYEFSSFPSGHAATAAGLAAAAWLVHRGWGAVLAVYAMAVMWSRIALQCHHLTDVVASTALAIPLAVLSKKILLLSVEFQFGNAQRALRKSRRPFGV